MTNDQYFIFYFNKNTFLILLENNCFFLINDVGILEIQHINAIYISLMSQFYIHLNIIYCIINIKFAVLLLSILSRTSDEIDVTVSNNFFVYKLL